MEEPLHHRGWLEPFKWHISTGAGFRNHPLYSDLGILIFKKPPCVSPAIIAMLHIKWFIPIIQYSSMILTNVFP